MNNVWKLDIDTVCEIYELALAHGKKAGESMQEEFDEVRKRHPDKFQCLGQTEQDIDLITGNLREEGKRVLNLNELQRGKDNENNTQ